MSRLIIAVFHLDDAPNGPFLSRNCTHMQRVAMQDLFQGTPWGNEDSQHTRDNTRARPKAQCVTGVPRAGESSPMRTPVLAK